MGRAGILPVLPYNTLLYIAQNGYFTDTFWMKLPSSVVNFTT